MKIENVSLRMMRVKRRRRRRRGRRGRRRRRRRRRRRVLIITHTRARDALKLAPSYTPNPKPLKWTKIKHKTSELKERWLQDRKTLKNR